jgi:type IV pilus assembly protein PilN
MIRINLLAVEREAKKKTATFQAGQKVTLACGLILILTVGVIGWRWWAINREGTQIDAEIAAAQAEATRLHGIIQQVQQFEQQRAQLQQRVVLIEQLRKSQTGPVHMLDQVSRALPPMLWLINLKQDEKDGTLTIEGRSTTQTGVSDFVSNLESSGYFKRSIDIVNTQAETGSAAAGGEIFRFQLKAVFQPPNEPAPLPGRGAPARGAAPAAATPPGGRK